MGAITTLVDKIIRELVDPAVAILFVAALAVFFWGMVQFIYSAGDEKMQTDGKKHMLWGVVGIFIMLSAFGILKLFTTAFGIPVN